MVKTVPYNVGVTGGMFGLLMLFNGILFGGAIRRTVILPGVSDTCVILHTRKPLRRIPLLPKSTLLSIVPLRFTM